MVSDVLEPWTSLKTPVKASLNTRPARQEGRLTCDQQAVSSVWPRGQEGSGLGNRPTYGYCSGLLCKVPGMGSHPGGGLRLSSSACDQWISVSEVTCQHAYLFIIVKDCITTQQKDFQRCNYPAQ